MFFSSFPITPYLNENSKIVFLTDLTKTFDISGSLTSDDIMTYSIKDGDTPESLSFKLTNTTLNSWVILLMNRIMDTNYDWPMDSSTFDHYIDKKYGNKLSLFLEISNIYGTFKTNDFVKIVNEDNELKCSGIVNSWDRTYGKLTITNYSGNFEQVTQLLKLKTERFFVKVNDKNAARIGRIVLVDSQSLHHFEGENGLYLDPHGGLLDSYSLFDSNDFVVTNYQYEVNQNDAKRRIILPSRKLVEKIKKDFKDKKVI